MMPSQDYGLSIHKLPWWAKRDTDSKADSKVDATTPTPLAQQQQRSTSVAKRAESSSISGNKRKLASFTSSSPKSKRPPQPQPTHELHEVSTTAAPEAACSTSSQPRTITPNESAKMSKLQKRNIENSLVSSGHPWNAISSSETGDFDPDVVNFIRALAIMPGCVDLSSREKVYVTGLLTSLVRFYANRQEMVYYLKGQGYDARKDLAFEFVCQFFPQSSLCEFQCLMMGKKIDHDRFLGIIEFNFRQFISMKRLSKGHRL